MGTKWVEDLLRQLGKEGRLYNSLTETEIDAILASTPDVKIRPEFRERALKGMQEAQQKREERKRQEGE